MANTLSKTGILPGTVVQASYVSQSIDAFTGVVPYNLTLNGNFYINGITSTTSTVGGTGSFIGSLNGTASYAITASHVNTIDTPTTWSQYATSASYSEGVLSDNVSTSSIPAYQPSVIIAGRGTILENENTFLVSNSYFNGKVLNASVWVTLLQKAPYPSLNSDYGRTCVIPTDISADTLVFSTVSGPALADLIFDFIITVQK
jgi:hypothetical protein